jgi:5-carboxymethyl-2-hydroxymuconate isomerase
MPHLIIEWSGNLRGRVDFEALLKIAHEAALGTGAFAVAALRTRGCERAHYRVADGSPDCAFVHATLRIRPGRDAATKRRIGETVFEAIADHLAPVFEAIPLGLTFEVHEIDTANRYVKGSIERHLNARQPTTEAVGVAQPAHAP